MAGFIFFSRCDSAVAVADSAPVTDTPSTVGPKWARIGPWNFQMSTIRYNKPIRHPDWIVEATARVGQFSRLYARGVVPKSIEHFMIVTPVKRVLRGVYGSDLKAAWALLSSAVWESLCRIPWRVRWFIRYSILRGDREADQRRWWAQMEAEDRLAAEAGDSDDD